MDSSPPPSKKRKLNTTTISTNRRPLTSLDAPISPPRRTPLPKSKGPSQTKQVTTTTSTTSPAQGPKTIPSPFQLTWIQDLPDDQNFGAVTLKDLLGDPMIKECWNFNYLHDIEFLLDAFDPDVKDLVQVKVIHGFWKNEDEGSRNALQVCCEYLQLQRFDIKEQS